MLILDSLTWVNNHWAETLMENLIPVNPRLGVVIKSKAWHRLLATYHEEPKYQLKGQNPQHVADIGTRGVKAIALNQLLKMHGLRVHLNQADFSLGCHCDFAKLLKAVQMLDFKAQPIPHGEPPNSYLFKGKDCLIRVRELREGWDPVIQILG